MDRVEGAATRLRELLACGARRLLRGLRLDLELQRLLLERRDLRGKRVGPRIQLRKLRASRKEATRSGIGAGGGF